MSQVEIQIDTANRLMHVNAFGSIEDRELLDLFSDLEKTLGIYPRFSLLVDVREADGDRLSNAGVKLLADRSLPLAPEARVAVIVPNDLGFGLPRMYELRRGDGKAQLQVFRELAEGLAWIAELEVQQRSDASRRTSRGSE